MMNAGCRRIAWVLLCAFMIAGCDAFLSADARVERANEHLAQQDYRAAMIELKNALRDEPNHLAARIKLAEVELQLGDAPSADKDLRRAIELGAPAEATSELMAKTQLALGKARELLVQLDSGEIALPDPAKELYRGQSLQTLQQYELAQRAFAQVPESDERFLSAQVGVAEALAGQGKSEEALSLLDGLLVKQPQAPLPLLARGAIRAKRGELEAGQTDLEQARKYGDGVLTSTQYLNLLAGITEVQISRGMPDAAAQTHSELKELAPDAVITRTLAARIALAKQDYTSAIAELQRAVAAAPNFAPNRFLLGAALLAQGNLRQAEQQLSQALQMSPENVEARKLLAQARLRLGQPDGAMQVLGPVQDAGDTDAQIDALLGLAHLQQGESDRGVTYLERAVAAQPQNANLKLDLALAYLRTNQASKALPLLSGIDRANADLRQMGLLIAALTAAKDVPQARSEIERLLAARPGDSQVLNLAASFFARQGEYDRARASSQRAIDAAPRDVPSLLVRASVEMAAGQAAAAETWLQKAAQIDPKSAPAHLALADIALRRGDAKTGAKVLEDLRKGDPASVDVRMRLALLYLRQRDSAAAAPVIDELLMLAKDRPDVLNALGLLYLDVGRYDEALSRFQAATAQDSASAEYWLNTARAQIALGRNATAREALERALSAQSGWMPAIAILAMLDVKEGRGASALDRVARLKSQRPQDPAVLTLEGDVYMALRDFEKAAGAYAAASAAKPTSVLAMKTYKARQAAKLPNPLQPLESWVAANPADKSARLLLAEGWQQAGDQRRAVAQYEAIDRQGGANAVGLNNLAWLYHELGDDRAEAVAKRAYDAAPGVPAIADTYGWILVEGGKAAQAVPLLRQAAQDAKDPSIEFHYAVALIRSGAATEGRKHLNELLHRSSNFPEAAEARKLLESPPGS